MRKLFHSVMFALLLLLAQQGAMLHGLNHLAQPPVGQESDDAKHAMGGLCAVCVAFSQVGTTALPDVVAPGVLAGLSFHVAPDAWVAGRARDLPSQHSRGPPSFL